MRGKPNTADKFLLAHFHLDSNSLPYRILLYKTYFFSGVMAFSSRLLQKKKNTKRDKMNTSKTIKKHDIVDQLDPPESG